MTSTMDNTEKHVREHLIHCGYAHIEYEPNGNIPPDFLVDGKIAVEVRRLNQRCFSESDEKGLEEVSIPLWNRLGKLLASFASVRHREGKVGMSFTDSLGRWELGKALSKRSGLVLKILLPMQTTLSVLLPRPRELKLKLLPKNRSRIYQCS